MPDPRLIDEIGMRELSMFLGLKLELMTADQTRPHELAGILDGRVYTNSWLQNTFDVSEIKPIVRPLGQMFVEITHGPDRFTPWDRLGSYRPDKIYTDEENSDLRCNFMANVHKGRVPYNKITRLISWHFDVFNWLGQCGVDGAPLAIPMNISQWEGVYSI